MKGAKGRTLSVRIINNYYGSVSKSKNLKKTDNECNRISKGR